MASKKYKILKIVNKMYKGILKQINPEITQAHNDFSHNNCTVLMLYIN
jgi:hypothetical protein